MPAFVVLPDPGGGIKGGPPAWGSGFLPATYQGTTMRSGKAPVLHLTPPEGMNEQDQLAVLNLLHQENEEHRALRQMDGELTARINTYELAYRMQAAAPRLVDIGQESPNMLKQYGVGEKDTDEFGTRCLLARRLLESGVRFVQLYAGNTVGWDAHEDVAENHSRLCRRTDKPVAGLIRDLQQRGLWDDTLVIWGGEFGRMPMSESGKGRDHNPWGYSVVLTGGAVKGGMAYGNTDEIGLRAVEKPVHVRDLHATLLHLLGLNHQELSYFHNGLDERLTGTTPASVVHAHYSGGWLLSWRWLSARVFTRRPTKPPKVRRRSLRATASTGRFIRFCRRSFRMSAIRAGHEIQLMTSFLRRCGPLSSTLRPKPSGSRSSAASRSISQACRRRPRKSINFLRIRNWALTSE
jgi:hypothetical protein